MCLFSDALLEARGETEDDSAPKSAVEKPPSTREMSAREAEDMADAMLRNSPLPDAERSDERPRRVVEATSFQRMKAARSSLRKPL